MNLTRLFLSSCAVVLAANSHGQATTDAAASNPQSRIVVTGTQLTVEDVWKLPRLNGVIMSDNGKHIAATAEVGGRLNLIVIDMDTRKASALTSFEDFDVLSPQWVGNERIVFTLGQFNSPTGPGEFDGGGLFVVRRDGKESRRLSPTIRELRNTNSTVFRQLSFFRLLPNTDEEIIASGNMTDAKSTDLYRLNLKTGKTTLLTSGRPASLTSNWVLDSKLVPRVVSASIKDTLTTVVYYRGGADQKWNEIARYDANKGPIFIPLAFEADDKTLQIAYNGNRETMAVFRYTPDDKKLGEMIAQHPRFDMGATASGETVPGVIVDPFSDKIVGYAVEADKREIVWVDEQRAKLQKTIDTSLPGRINSLRRTPTADRYIVTSYSDTVPISWYIFDTTKKTLEEIGSSRPWLNGKLVEQKPFVYKTRDGIEITGYYFLPKDYKTGTALPTILHIHGGPFARADRFGSGFGYLEAQLFASRGYAVVVPNFRSTPGIGNKVYYAGFGSYGKQMVEDHEDALKWAIGQGFTDSKRVCLSGASYGGYAALMTPAKNPTMFKCAIAGLAVTDMKYQLSTPDGDTRDDDAGVAYWKSILGTSDLSSQAVKDISPVYLADKIKIPVFLYAGQDDVRVPIDQINRMNKALTAAGNPPKAYVVKAKEGHGFGKLENNVDLYTQMLKFLSEHLEK